MTKGSDFQTVAIARMIQEHSRHTIHTRSSFVDAAA